MLFRSNKYNFSENWNDQNYTGYTAVWYANEEHDYYYIAIDVYKFENKSFNAYTITDEITKYNMCVEREFEEETIYICDYNYFYEDEDKSKYNEVIWARNNVFVRINTLYSKNYITEEQKNLLEHKKLQDFINSLKNNEFNWENTNFDLNYHFNSVIEKHLNLCQSDLEPGKLPFSYYCKVEPVICPEYGYQKQICIAWNPVTMEEISKERQISCSPGICSGCYVPRWFNYYYSGNICIPYGFRFESQIGWKLENASNSEKGKLSVAEAKEQSDELSLLISEEEVVTLWVKDWGNQTYTFRQGDRVDVNVTGWNYIFTSLSFVATEVVYDKKDENSYVVFDFTYTYLGNVEDTINAYCDIDGNVKPQKTKVEGEWAKCQNNYECDSNLCSYGECVELKDIAGEVSAFKTIVMKFFCRLTNLFNNENYEQCLIDNGIETGTTDTG